MNTTVIKRRLLAFYWRIWYWYLTRKDKTAEVTFMNYGYVEEKQDKSPNKKGNYQTQLYDHIASAVSLTQKDILEVGCGRGGGAYHLTSKSNPKSFSGVDICKAAIHFCKNHYSDKRLLFFHSDALKLPFNDESFDVVINIESSHCYKDIDKFLEEICRMLKLHGYFLFADFRKKREMDALKKKMSHLPLGIVREENITRNVTRALNLDNERKQDLIQRLVPKVLHKPAVEFAGTVGSNTYNLFDRGEYQYMYFVLQKQGS